MVEVRESMYDTACAGTSSKTASGLARLPPLYIALSEEDVRFAAHVTACVTAKTLTASER